MSNFKARLKTQPISIKYSFLAFIFTGIPIPGKIKAGERSRTSNLLITNQLLFH